jgi:hypothetical protein
MQINAIATERTLDVRAALESSELRPMRSLMARADIHPTGKITVAELDRKFASAGSKLSVVDRIALKSALSRAGLLED